MSRIARNAAIDVRRLKKFENNRKTLSLDLSLYNAGVESPINNKLDVTVLLQKLDPKYAQVLQCVFIQGHTHVEAADILKLPIGTIKTRIRKAISNLREILKNEKDLFLGSFEILIIYFFLCL